ncbi:protein-glutamine gamma-glutamyltransferase [Paenibacillus montanisoli]|uniref:Protein-glutamine gamma-glutamyltransferase n=1 Tax=Paenibacillus montanisoli TaxID=2081970 RepID=A0A328TYZ9_9BACL|nr:protein-glutamine gamma-glutamyltransferase [Paenibacillus montanisoli]RAP75719.1 protein-glutamine gamma-glutamyltransferase [Paenibacillus montanisoli]
MQFEPTLRANIIKAAKALSRGGAEFETFRTSFCNQDYWILTNEGGFLLRKSETPSEGIQDIFSNGKKYGFECATAIIIIIYKGVLDTLGNDQFNKLFPNLHLYSWQIDSDLGLIQEHAPSANAQPGDVLYFKNPEVDPEEMEWRGENVIKIDDDLFFGHGIGIKNAKGIIRALNKHRVPQATESAYLEDQFIYPDFDNLSKYAPADMRKFSHKAGRPNPNAVCARIGARKYIRN